VRYLLDAGVRLVGANHWPSTETGTGFIDLGGLRGFLLNSDACNMTRRRNWGPRKQTRPFLPLHQRLRIGSRPAEDLTTPGFLENGSWTKQDAQSSQSNGKPYWCMIIMEIKLQCTATQPIFNYLFPLLVACLLSLSENWNSYKRYASSKADENI
jgi:hypothetical protein